MAGGIVNQLDTVSLCDTLRGWLQIVLDLPDICAIVLGLLDDWVLWDGVGAWALEEEQSDGALGGWLPGDCEVAAGRDDGVQAWLREWVAERLWTHRLGVGRGEGCESSQAGREEGEVAEVGHVDCALSQIVYFGGLEWGFRVSG